MQITQTASNCHASPRKTVTKARFMLMRDMQADFGRSRQWFYTKLRDDPTFPKPVKIGAFSIAWIRSEVESWIQHLPRVQATGLSSVELRKMAQTRRAAQ